MGMLLAMLPAFIQMKINLHNARADAGNVVYEDLLPYIIGALGIVLLLGILMNSQKRHGSVSDCLAGASTMPAALYSGAALFNLFA